MNFNIYVEDTLGAQLDQLVQQQGKKRNAVIRKALENWVKQHRHEIALLVKGPRPSH